MDAGSYELICGLLEYVLLEKIKNWWRGSKKRHVGAEVCNALGLNANEVTDLTIDVYPGYLRVNASFIINREKVVNKIIRVLEDTKDAG